MSNNTPKPVGRRPLKPSPTLPAPASSDPTSSPPSQAPVLPTRPAPVVQSVRSVPVLPARPTLPVPAVPATPVASTSPPVEASTVPTPIAPPSSSPFASSAPNIPQDLGGSYQPPASVPEPYAHQHNVGAPEQSFYPASSGGREEPPQPRTRDTKSSVRKVKKKPNTLRGGRKTAILIRITTLTLLALLVLLGIKNTIIPPGINNKNEIINLVQQELNITNYPTDQGAGWALAFMETWLNYDPNNPTARKTALENFADTNIANQGISHTGTLPQTIILGPYIAGTRNLDNANTIYTISALLNNNQWTFYDVTVYYNQNTRSFTIPAPPNLTIQPPLAETPLRQDFPFKPDEEAAKSAENTIKTFFQAWADSDTEALSVVVHRNADPRANIGLNKQVTFKSLSNLTIYPENDIGTPIATVTVEWEQSATQPQPDNKEGEPQPPTERTTTIKSEYQLQLDHSGQGKWTIKDILPLSRPYK